MMKLINSDCIAAMKEMPDNSVDSIVTDPPYELGFMGKSWDSTGIANSVEMWREALRVLKPGGHLLAFSGSRTYHRMACAIEDAGFEIRDQIMWVYGSGFPKSHNISKALDKTAGVEREVVGRNPNGRENSTKDNTLFESGIVGKTDYITKPSSEEAKKWDGWGTALKPAHEPIVLARKPFEGTIANNVLIHGTGGLNIDGCRVGTEDTRAPASKTALGMMNDDNWKAQEVMAGSANGRFPANFIHDGSDEVVELFPDAKGMAKGGATQKGSAGINIYGGNSLNKSKTTFPENRLGFNDSGSAARFFYCAKASKRDRNEGFDGFEDVATHRYGAGIGEGLTPDAPSIGKNHHPTVKPTDLMRYLCRLITPPNGTVLDPFMGSGSTGKAAILEGFDFIGIDQSAEYLEIARARIEFVKQEPTQDFLL